MSNQTDSNQSESDEERAARETRDIDERCEEALYLAHVRLGIEYTSRVTGLRPDEVTEDVMDSVAELTRVLQCSNEGVSIYFYDGLPVMAATTVPTLTVERVGNEPATVTSSFLILHDEGMRRNILSAFMNEGADLLRQSRP